MKYEYEETKYLENDQMWKINSEKELESVLVQL